MKLLPINIAKLGNEDTHGISLATVNIFNPHIASLDNTAKAALQNLEAKTTELGKQLNRQQANTLTKSINELNKTTDGIWREIKAAVTRTAKSLVNTDKAQMASQLADFLNPYWTSENLSTHTQTANFTELFDKYTKSETMQNTAEAISVSEALALLQAKNTEMASMWQQRNDIQGNITATPSASNVCKEVATTYSRFSQAVENQHTFTPTTELAALISDMNEIRSKYSALIDVRAAARKRVKDKQVLPPPPAEHE